MSKRNYIDEILALKSRRHKRGKRWAHVSRRLHPLRECTAHFRNPGINPKSIREELVRYLPVAHISLLEGFFRLVYADLINSGGKYLANAQAFKDFRFSVDTVLAVGKSVKAGELVAHLLPHKSLSDIVENMNTILGEDFKHALELITPKVGDAQKTIVEVSPEVWRGVQRVFEMRHIICHELATRVDFKPVEVMSSCNDIVLVIAFTERYVRDLLAEA